MNLEDKNIRKALAEKYLSAETSVEEERALACYYSDHQAEEDEKAFAAMVTATAGDYLLSDEGAEEYDWNAAPKAIPLKINIFRWAFGTVAVAAAVILGVILFQNPVKETPISAVTIAETIGEIMRLNEENILSIEAKPQGSKAVLTVNLKNGITQTYIMTLDEETGATLLTQLSSTN
jgi:hypothetical protein